MHVDVDGAHEAASANLQRPLRIVFVEDLAFAAAGQQVCPLANVLNVVPDVFDRCFDQDQMLCFDHGVLRPRRSEEHTSELQSLMRISYAVFCLKTKSPHESINDAIT